MIQLDIQKGQMSYSKHEYFKHLLILGEEARWREQPSRPIRQCGQAGSAQ